MKAVCAVDVGSTNVKAAVFDPDRRLLAAAAAPFPARRDGRAAEADGDTVWQTFVTVVRRAVSGTSLAVSALSVAAQMAGLALLDGKFRPTGPVVLGIDRRAVPDTVSPAPPYQTVHRIAWAAAHRPAQLRQAEHLGGIKEMLLQRLVGVWVTDPATASATGLYDVVTGRWSVPDLVRDLVAASMLPVVRPCTEVIGILTTASATALGLAPRTLVHTGIGDGPAANLSTAAVGGGRLCLSLGTTCVARIMTDIQPVGPVPGCPLPQFVQRVNEHWYCVGVRLDPTGAGHFRDPRKPDLKLAAADLPRALAPFLEAAAITQIHPAGGGHSDRALALLADHWRLPVVSTGYCDGTFGAATLAWQDATWPADVAGLMEQARFLPQRRTVPR